MLALGLGACDEVIEDDFACHDPAPPAEYHDKRTLDLRGEWYYLRTFFGSRSSLEGLARLDEVTLTLSETALTVTDLHTNEVVASWPVLSHFDLLPCFRPEPGPDLGVVQRGTWSDRDFVAIDWSAPQAGRGVNLAVRVPGWTATLAPGAAVDPSSRFDHDYLEVTEGVSLTLDAATCAETSTSPIARAGCGAAGRLRHSLVPRNLARGDYHPRAVPRYERFGHLATNGNLERVEPGDVTYYLAHDAPEAWTSIAGDLSWELTRVWQHAGAVDGSTPNFELRPNDCRPDRVREVVTSAQEYRSLAEAIVCGTAGCPDPIAVATNDELARVCDALERASGGAFTWQRPGDLRFNLVAPVWAAEPLFWGAWSSRAVDPVTAQIVQATAWIDATRLGRIAERVAAIASDPGPRYRSMRATIERRTEDLATAIASAELVADVAARATSTVAIGWANVEELRERLDRYAGSALETAHGDEPRGAELFAGPRRAPDAPLPAWAERYARPSARVELLASTERRALLAKLASHQYCWLARDVDTSFDALADEVRGLAVTDAARWVHERLASHVVLHALGHNLGLAHDLAASADVLNHADDVWTARFADPDDVHPGTSSVMDLLPGAHQARATTLGRHDEAALRHAYRSELQVFGRGHSVDPAALRDRDYRAQPDLVCGPGGCASSTDALDALADRAWVPATDAPWGTIPAEVPFLRCNEAVAYLAPTPFCQVHDVGANAREIFASRRAEWLDHFRYSEVDGATAR
ncbi:hypothetical protein L6R52_15400, partial [Myxococcota bacterium]|nr:hypothetical protein [Myxococcota bacterium]